MSGAPLALTPGDPLGIGPEITVRWWADRRDAGTLPRVCVIGDADAMVAAAEARGVPLRLVDGPDRVVEDACCVFAVPDAPAPVAAASIHAAVAWVRSGACSALVTGPIHKARLAARGFAYPGHTELLGALCGVQRPVMAFVGGRVRVALTTVHLPLRRVPDAVTVDAVLHTARVAHHALVTQVGLPNPRLVVCGLNPHAGDAGLLGDEELRVIGPACEQLRADGLDVVGPVSAEAAFVGAVAGRYDIVIAMYHDQGLAPLKALDFGRTVNWTLGLPIVRTSVDHGTADDLVGTGRADASSLHAAVDWAEQLVALR